MEHAPRHIANKLWIARQRAGLEQKSVARLLGNRCSSPISEYEHGRLVPSLRTALKLQVIYGVPVSEMYAPLYEEISREIAGLRGRYVCAGNVV